MKLSVDSSHRKSVINPEKPFDLWDKWADSYTHLDLSYYPTRLKMDLLLKYSLPTFRCLDVGIANGIYSLPLANKVKSIAGIDFSQKMLENSQKAVRNLNNDNVFLYQANAEDLPFKKETYDLVFSFATLPLIPDFKKAIQEIVRVMKVGGVAILDITGRDNLSRVHWQKFYRLKGQFGVNSSSLHELARFFPENGLEFKEIHPVGVLDQWKFIPVLNKLSSLSKIFHAKNAAPDLDYRISNLIPVFANHYFLVLEKRGKE
ncbi:MAG: class I SAM-dependent methyltransferase [Anaerolineaceae bacterium]